MSRGRQQVDVFYGYRKYDYPSFIPVLYCIGAYPVVVSRKSGETMTQDIRTSNAPFSNLPQGPHDHFLLHLYAVIAHLLAHINMGESDTNYFDHLPFLLGYQKLLSELAPDEEASTVQDAWWERQIANWEAEATGQWSQSITPLHLPLQALREEMGLRLPEILLLVAVGLVEEDI